MQHDAAEEAERDVAPSAFSVLHEKALSQQVVLGCWCPTMDLLALVSDDGQLGVYRLEWQKLWVACPDAPVTALCWRPDGKVLATGHRHGAVSLYDVEACELFRTLRHPHPHGSSPIACLSWVQGLPPTPATATPALHLAYRYRHTRFFPAPPPGREGASGGAASAGGAGPAAPKGAAGGGANGAGGAASAGANSYIYEWPPPRDSLDVLVTCDALGGVSMSACGEVLVAALPPAPPQPAAAAATPPVAPYGPHGEAGGGIQALLSRDLCTLVVLSEPAGPSGRAASSASSSPAAAAAVHGHASAVPAAVLSVYGCGVLGECQAEVLELAQLGSLVGERLEAAAAALAAAARSWKGAAAELGKRLDEQLREALESHGHDPDDLVGELLCTLAAGHVSPPLQAFLTNTLTEPGLRRLAKTVDSAVQEVGSQLLDGVLPALQLVAFVAGELRGRARAAAITGSLGLQERAVAVAEVEAAKALLQAEALRQLVSRVGAQYRAFFTWLLKTLQGLEEARPEGEDAPLPGGSGSLAGVAVDVPSLLAFLEEGGQFGSDAVARDLDASQATLGLPVGSLRFPPELLPHLKSLQDAAFPWPDPESGFEELGLGLTTSGPGPGPGPAGPGPGPGRLAAPASEGSGTSWPDRPLQRQLGLLTELWRGAFGQLERDVSPSLQLLARVPLLPEPSLLWGPRLFGGSAGGWGRCALSAPQVQTDPAAGQPALVAAVLPAEAVAGLARAGAQALARAGEAVLLARASTNPLPGKLILPQPRVCLLALPPGLTVLGISYYRDGQLALLMGPCGPVEGADGPEDAASCGGGGGRAAAAGGGEAARGLLALVPTQGLNMVSLPRSAAASAAEHCARNGAVAPWPLPGTRLRRAPPGGGWSSPLLVSAPRGLAALFTDACRAFMLDLQEDEEEEEEEGGEGEEGEGGGEEESEEGGAGGGDEDRMEEDG